MKRSERNELGLGATHDFDPIKIAFIETIESITKTIDSMVFVIELIVFSIESIVSALMQIRTQKGTENELGL